MKISQSVFVEMFRSFLAEVTPRAPFPAGIGYSLFTIFALLA